MAEGQDPVKPRKAPIRRPRDAPASREDTALDDVRSWFARENRPSALQGLVDALGSRHSKPHVQRALDVLVADGVILTKEFKKAVVYFPRVHTAAETEEGTPADSPVSDADVAAVTEVNRALAGEVKSIQTEATRVAGHSLLVLRARCAAVRAANDALRPQAEAAAHAAASSVTPEMVTAILRRVDRLAQLVRHRTDTVSDVLTFFQGDRQRGDVLAELGLE